MNAKASPISSRDDVEKRKRTLVKDFDDAAGEESTLEQIEVDKTNVEVDNTSLAPSVPVHRHDSEWLAHLEANFESTIVGGLSK